MEQKVKPEFDQSIYPVIFFKSYKIAKKVLKYAIYGTILYFAYQGFMGWD